MGILRAAAASRSLDGVVAAGRHRIVLLQRYATCTDSLTRTNQGLTGVKENVLHCLNNERDRREVCK